MRVPLEEKGIYGDDHDITFLFDNDWSDLFDPIMSARPCTVKHEIRAAQEPPTLRRLSRALADGDFDFGCQGTALETLLCCMSRESDGLHGIAVGRG